MHERGLFLQNIIAVIWDFDKTLSPHYMQRPIFEAYGVDENRFWQEVNSLPAWYRQAGIPVQKDICYLGHLLSYVRSGVMEGLSNRRLREFGARISFFDGVPGIFKHLRAIANEVAFNQGDLRVEHYIVSTGLAEMIRGSAIAPEVDGIWASEFIEHPALPGQDFTRPPVEGAISQIAGFLDNTTKTRAIFEINKGVNVEPSITVNDMIPEEERRVPVRNMIYIADGPSDIPCFSVVRKHGGLAYAVYAPGDERQFAQASSLLESRRVDAFGPADFREETQTGMWLTLQVRRIAQRIMEERKTVLTSRVGKEPTHQSTDGS